MREKCKERKDQKRYKIRMVPKIIDPHQRNKLGPVHQIPTSLGKKCQVPIIIPQMRILINQQA